MPEHTAPATTCACAKAIAQQRLPTVKAVDLGMDIDRADLSAWGLRMEEVDAILHEVRIWVEVSLFALLYSRVGYYVEKVN